MEPLLSICIVSYNHEKYIKECIESIWANDYKNIEILVLDDGSSDNSVNILFELQKESPYPMYVFTQKNSGKIGANFNKLITKSKGKYLTTISADDKLIENSLNFKMQKMIDDENIAFLCHSKVIGINEKSKITYKVPPIKLDDYKNPSIDDLLKMEYAELGAYYMQGTIYLKTIVDIIGGFDDDMICDDIVFRTKFAFYVKNNPKYKFEVLHCPGFYYRRHSDNISSNTKRQVIGVIQYLQKYWTKEKPPKPLIDWTRAAIKSSNDFKEVFITDEYLKQVFDYFINHKLFKILLFLERFNLARLGYKFNRLLQRAKHMLKLNINEK